MSKDKGNKNKKKAKADKNTGKKKVISDYKAEGKKEQPTLDVFTPKPDGGNKKKR
jgi:hypothetical protein